MKKILDNANKKPEIQEIFERKKPPHNLITSAKLQTADEKLTDDENKARIDLTKWYVREILEFRKKLTDSGKAYEKYYQEVANRINNINEILKKELPVS